MHWYWFLVWGLLLAFARQGLVESAVAADDAARGGSLGMFPIVYLFTIHNNTCQYGMPSYVQYTLQQAVWSQPNSRIFLISNYADCPYIKPSLGYISGIDMVDIRDIISDRTYLFKNLSVGMFMSDSRGELWYESAFRFFYIEDFMLKFNVSELIHFEADNLIYGDIAGAVPDLRKYYPHLAVTPLTANKNSLTASALWVASPRSLVLFNDFLLELGHGRAQGLPLNATSTWNSYIHWLYRWARCQGCGWYKPENGDGIKPFGFNEMTMMAFYHYVKPEEYLNLLPIVPLYNYKTRRPFCNMTFFSSAGPNIGKTGSFIWDSGSWGQYMGGTDNRHGRNPGFTDAAHIIGQAIIVNGCHARMVCSNTTLSVRNKSHKNPNGDANKIDRECYTIPHVRCDFSSEWTPLHNIHVHSKHTKQFVSHVCPCESS